MTEVPLWSLAVLPAVLGAATIVAIAFDVALSARAGGRAASLTEVVVVPLREAVRLLVGQRRVTTAADRVLWRTGVVTVPVIALLAALVLPLGGVAVADLGVGVVWFNAMEILAWAAVWMAGWGPNSVLSLVGGYRFVAQGLAYELPHMFALISAATAAGTLRVGGIVEAQSGVWFVVWMPVAFVVYLLSAVAMAFRGPFDAPTGRDLAGGAVEELSGVDRLVFQGGRWLLLVVAVAMSVPLFLGGGHGPLLPPWLWTVLKTAAVLAAVLWLRRKFPTVRMDRFAEIAWVVLIPLTILQALAVGVLVLTW
ncbi:NADH-quinone oxidoreductase subunit H [Saccharopolyspora lacisalsi]|uniref:NADH-quinone oxidoreductase subunit H n=1 Tax=Halosaccharopolyspora lacisalsi TaxID=1000566 RepID=A0A839DT29_9PSEU|nr:complex I subunit 1 family protein [Halosaccharopolyspora lacisalsi]MBA8824100.1 NADH-quinone oxidoreductase subunit H [Halosaccharopolyspora lacisalsi]